MKKKMILASVMLAIAFAVNQKVDAVVCESLQGYTCDTTLGVHCKYSANPYAICNHDSLKCSCGNAYQDNCDLGDLCPFYQDN